MKLLDGLHFYEIVMLVLGILLFLVLVFAFVSFVVKGKPFGGLLAFFAVPIAMIGYPSIKSSEISQDTVKIEKITEELRQKPTNTTLRQELRTTTDQVASRPVTSAGRATIIANAQFALGDDSAATATLAQALRIDPNAPKAAELQQKIEVLHNLESLAARVEKNPGDPNARAELASSVAKVSSAAIANPKALMTIARAQAAIGEHDKALVTAETAVKVNPVSIEATALRNAISARVVLPTPKP